jgi:hypothetical protein
MYFITKKCFSQTFHCWEKYLSEQLEERKYSFWLINWGISVHGQLAPLWWGRNIKVPKTCGTAKLLTSWQPGRRELRRGRVKDTSFFPGRASSNLLPPARSHLVLLFTTFQNSTASWRPSVHEPVGDILDSNHKKNLWVPKWFISL